MRKLIASATIAIAAALATASAVAAVTAAAVDHGVQAASSDNSPNLYMHS